MKWAILPALASISGGLAAAQIVCYEGFEEYDAGSRVETGGNSSDGTGLDGGTGWGGPYNVSNAIKSLVRIEDRTASPTTYSNGEITIQGGVRALRFYDIANGSFAVQRPLGTVFQAAAGDTLWFSILFRTNNASQLSNQDFFQIGFDDNPNASAGNPRVSIGANTTSGSFPADFRFFARSTTAVAASAFHESVPIAAATTYLLVGSIFSSGGSTYDTVSLYVNPASAEDPGPPSASIVLNSGLATLSHSFIRTASLDNGDAYVLDEWRIGRDYGAVVQSLRNALRILPASEPGGSLALRWPASLTGVVLETSTTLEPGSWTEITGPFSLAASESTFSIPMDPEIPRGFFRLRR